GSEGPQLKELALEGAAADALDAGKRPPPEEHIALQAEDFVFGERGIVGEIEPGAVVLEERCGSSRGPGSQDPAIDGLYVGSVCRGVAIGIEGPGIGWDGARGPRGAGARGPGREDLGVALEQAGDGVAQPVAREAFDPPAPSLHIDLDDVDV